MLAWVKIADMQFAIWPRIEGWPLSFAVAAIRAVRMAVWWLRYFIWISDVCYAVAYSNVRKKETTAEISSA